METYLQPREVVLDFGLLPLQVLCPQLDTVAGVVAAHRGLAALATTAGDGRKYVSCSAVAAALDLPEQQCRLLLETLAAVSSNSSRGGQQQQQQQQQQPQASGDLACLHELSLFLLAQIYGRDSHRPETQDHWPDASTSGGGQLEPQLKAASRQPGSPSASSNSRLLIKAQLQALQRQHASYARGYADFLERHTRVLLELVLDDTSSIEEWQQQRAALLAQQKAAAGLLQQQHQQPLTAAAAQQRQHQQPLTAAAAQQRQQHQQQLDAPMQQPAPPAGDDSEMTPVDEDGGSGAASSAMDVQQPGGGDAASGMQLSPKAGEAAGSMFGVGAQQQQQHTPGAGPGSSIALAPADKAGSLGSSGSLVSLGGSSLSYPPVSITAAEFNRLGFLLEAFRVSKATLAAILESSAAAAASSMSGSGGGGGTLGGSSSGGGGGGGPLGGASSRSLFSDLRVSGAAAAGCEASSSSSAGGGDGWRALSAYVPGYATAGSLSMEEVGTWMAASWLHKMQQAAAQQHKAAAAAAATAAAGASPSVLGAVGVLGGGVSPLLQQPAFGSTPAAPAGLAQPQQPQAGSSGVASMLAEMSAASGGSSAVAGWLGMAGSPPNSNSQQLSVLASPGGLVASGPAAAGSSGFGSFIGINGGLPVVTSVSTGGPSPLTALQQQQQAAAATPPGVAGSPGGGFGFVAATPGSGTPGAAGSSPAAPVLGVGSLLNAGPGQGLNSIRVNTTKGMVAVAGGCVDDAHVTGVYRGTVVRGPADAAGDCITIQDCSEAHVYILAPVKLARIVNCNDCNICIGAVSTLLRIERCERLQLTAAAGQVLVVSCHSCCLHLGTPRMPAILGDCRFVKLAPFNTRYEALYQHLAAAGLSPGKPSLWDVPLIITTAGSGGHSGAGGSSCSGGGGSSRGGSSCGGAGAPSSQHCSDPAAAAAQRRPGAATPSSPHTLGSSSSAERRGGVTPPKPVLLMPPEEFFPLVVPFRGTAGPLAGGAAHHASTHWQPNSHKHTQGPLPPFPFPLPPEYDAALQQQYGVVTELRSKIKSSGLDDTRRAQLQNVIQSYFREWLHHSGAIRQVYDLSKLEGDEYGLTGGSPTAALRDTHSL